MRRFRERKWVYGFSNEVVKWNEYIHACGVYGRYGDQVANYMGMRDGFGGYGKGWMEARIDEVVSMEWVQCGHACPCKGGKTWV